eukprot:scaffold84304_cov60-Phaeocystis_antarctica.AAC.2
MGAPDNREQYVHRTGRTGRAGKTGQATLLLSDWEARSALMMLKNLPVSNSGDEVAALLKGAAPDAAKAVQAVRVEAREKAYQAWLGYYNPNPTPSPDPNPNPHPNPNPNPNQAWLGYYNAKG